MSDILSTIQKLAKAENNEYIKKASGDGKKILGYMCSFVPEEIIHAAGMVPFRLTAVGSTETRQGDAYYSAINCSLIRHIFDKALKKEFSFLDGVVFMNGCDHSRRMYDNWRDALKTQGLGPEYLHMFIAPHTTTESSLRRFVKEIRGFADSLEQHFGATITDDALLNSIEIYNRRRKLLRKLNDMRKRPAPSVSGSEMLAVQLALASVPVENAIDLLEELISHVESREIDGQGKLRVTLTGGAMEEINHVKMIEDSGAIVVAENMCTGGRHADVLTQEGGDPYDQLAERYLRKTSCPRMIDEFYERSESLEKTIKEYNVDAVIAEKLMFCDLCGGEIFLLRREAKRLDYPILVLEREIYGGGEGQMRTRVQAFFETVRNLQ